MTPVAPPTYDRPMQRLRFATFLVLCGCAATAPSRQPQADAVPHVAKAQGGDCRISDRATIDLAAPADVAAAPVDAVVTRSGLASRLLRSGCGTVHPGSFSEVTVHYAGWTTDGRLFEYSVARGKTANFPLNGVISGWREGVKLMVAGEKRRFWIPEELAYKGMSGPQGTLVFDIELIAVGR